MLKAIALTAVAALILATAPVEARNTPCSGKKGGVSHCKGEHFVCRDGSVSQSKRNCSQDRG